MNLQWPDVTAIILFFIGILYATHKGIKMFDITKLFSEAQSEVNREQEEALKKKLQAQIRAVRAAEAVLRGERLKLEDLKQQIADGTA